VCERNENVAAAAGALIDDRESAGLSDPTCCSICVLVDLLAPEALWVEVQDQ
jgi:hypothetical protein